MEYWQEKYKGYLIKYVPCRQGYLICPSSHSKSFKTLDAARRYIDQLGYECIKSEFLGVDTSRHAR